MAAGTFPAASECSPAIPLPDAEGSLREIAYALDTLQLDGHRAAHQLCRQAARPIPRSRRCSTSSNRRKVALFVHPTMSCCGMKIPGVDAPAIDFPTDHYQDADEPRPIAARSRAAPTSSSSSPTAAGRCR